VFDTGVWVAEITGKGTFTVVQLWAIECLVPEFGLQKLLEKEHLQWYSCGQLSV